jgi:hypothetical protein
MALLHSVLQRQKSKKVNNSMEITKEYLRNNPSHILVFEDTEDRLSTNGYASLRDLQNTYSLATRDTKFCNALSYSMEHYEKKFYKELTKLVNAIETNPEFTFLISRMDANFELNRSIFEPKLKGVLKRYKNVKFIYEDEEYSRYYVGYINQKGKLVIQDFATLEEARLKIDLIKDSKIALKGPGMAVKATTTEKVIEEFTISFTDRDTYFDND